MLFPRPLLIALRLRDLGAPATLVVLAVLAGLTTTAAANAQAPCTASNMTGMWKLISEEPAADAGGPSQAAAPEAVPPEAVPPEAVPPEAEYLELRSGQLFWVMQTSAGKTRSRHKVYFSGSTVDVRPALAKAPQITRCTRTGRRLVLLTASFGSDGAPRRGRLEFRKTGR